MHSKKEDAFFAQVKNLFNLTSYLTRRDAWAGDFSELLLEAPRTDAPMHLPDAVAPVVPWCSQLTSNSTCIKNGGCAWNSTTGACQEGNDHATMARRQMSMSLLDRFAEEARPQHCSARASACQAAGEVTARQKNRMVTLGALTGVAVPPLDELDAAAANGWLAARWQEYTDSSQR